MYKNNRVLIIATIILVIAVQIPYSAFADLKTELTVKTDVLEMTPGNTFAVSITFSSKLEDISVVQASIEYDSDIIEYQFAGNAIELSSGSGGISDNISSGTKTVSYEIRFKALKAGKAKIAVTQSQLIGSISGSVLGEPVGEIVVKVSEPTIEPGDDIDDEPKETPPSTEQPSDDIWLKSTLEGDLIYVSKDLSDVMLPKGFEIENIVYQDEEIQAAQDYDRDLTLIYIRERGFTSFYIYDEKGLVYPYAELDVKTGYTILETNEVPIDSVATTLLIDNKPVKAWISDIYGEEFYIVYAKNSNGSKSFYLYDSVEGSMQRLIVVQNNTNTIDIDGENRHDEKQH